MTFLWKIEASTFAGHPISGHRDWATRQRVGCERWPRALEAQLINPLEGSEWDQLIASHPAANIFHTSAWAKVLNRSYGHRPVYLRFTRAGAVVALVPMMEVRSFLTGRRGVCLPFTDFCAPLTSAGCDFGQVLSELAKVARKQNWKHFEIRDEIAFKTRASRTFHGHALDLRSGSRKIFENFTGSVRRAIRKAERSSLVVEISRERSAMHDFYQLHGQTRRRHGLPPQPFSFFQRIQDEVLNAGLGVVVTAKGSAGAVAGAVFLRYGAKAVYKYGASDAASLESRANNLVMWQGIQYLASNGCETLHFGRTSPQNDGLRRFKLGWGAVEQTIPYFKFDASARASESECECDKAVGLHNALFRRLPLPMNRLAGAMIYPHLD